MKIKPLNSKLEIAGKIYQLFAIVDTYGHTVIQVPSRDLAQKWLLYLQGRVVNA